MTEHTVTCPCGNVVEMDGRRERCPECNSYIKLIINRDSWGVRQ